jgi:hypothetical protein
MAATATFSPSAGLTGAQKEMADLILREFRSAGFGAAVGMAAVANAYAESGLNPLAKSGFVGEDSVGLFQLNVKGVGAGMSTAERQDPLLNTRKMIDAAKRSSQFMSVANNPSATLADVVTAFCTYVERPANAAAESAKRVGIAQRIFGAGVTAVAAGNISQSGASNTVVVVATLSAAALAATLFWVYRDTIRARLG